MTRVFAQNDIDSRQRRSRTRGQIAEIAYRCSDDIHARTFN